MGLGGQVHTAAAVIETPLKVVILGSVGADVHGRGEKGTDGVAFTVASQRGEVAGLDPVTCLQEQDLASSRQGHDDTGNVRRIRATDGDDLGFRQVLVQTVERILTTCGTDDDDVSGLGAADVHKAGISIS